MHSQSGTDRKSLADRLVETWAAQGRDGFLLNNPATTEIPMREAWDRRCDVTYRYRWMPHREVRGDVAELERRGILSPDRDESKLFREARDPSGRHCFLCAGNIAECHPMETLLPIQLSGREYFAGANFAWIERNHFTVMSAEHVGQVYSRHVMEAMLDLHLRTGGRFRVLFNGIGAGASIPWHLHYQITTEAMPIERLQAGSEDDYPTAVSRFPLGTDGLDHAHFAVEKWLEGDAQNRSTNILVAPIGGDPCVFVFARDQRHASASGIGLVGGFEVAGDIVLSSPHEEHTFKHATVSTARENLGQVCPPDWTSSVAA